MHGDCGLRLNTRGVAGTVPSISSTSPVTLKSLSLLCFGLSGTLPHHSFGLPALESFRVAQVLVSGTIPSGSAQSVLNVSRSEISGVVGALSDYLSELQLQECHKLSGTFPAVNSRIKTFLSYSSSLSGTIPSEISFWHDTLQFLMIGEGRISGALPPSFRSLSRLSVLDLSSSQLQGDILHIPMSPAMRNLHLQKSKFSGADNSGNELNC